MNGNDAARRAFDELRNIVRQSNQVIFGLRHDLSSRMQFLGGICRSLALAATSRMAGIAGASFARPYPPLSKARH
jgi:hypothetical protein